jgi:hypothetical protein
MKISYSLIKLIARAGLLVPFILLSILLFFLGNYAYNNRDRIREANKIIDTKSVYKIELNFNNSIPLEDSLIIIKLIPILKKREGFSPILYQNEGDSRWYIGYGHQMLYRDFSDLFFLKLIDQVLTYQITRKQADLLLWNDILRAYRENERIKKKTLKSDVYKLFTSGHK